MTRPFRLGATSYTYPDTLVSNVRRLAPLVDDVEFVLFDVAGYGCNFPTAAEVEELAGLAAEFALTYTVHLPIDVYPGNGSLELARRAITATAALDPFAVVLHFDGNMVAGAPDSATIAAWQQGAEEALRAVIDWVGDARRLCVENLERWNPRLFDAVVARAGVSRCVDIGHLWLEGVDPLPYLAAHAAQTRVIHLHGVGERDHASLSRQPREQVTQVIESLLRHDFRGVVTLEVFSEEDLFSSMRLLDAILDTSEKRVCG